MGEPEKPDAPPKARVPTIDHDSVPQLPAYDRRPSIQLIATITTTAISALSLLVATGGFLIVRSQLTQLQQSVQQARIDTIYKQCHETMDHLITHPDIRDYFVNENPNEPAAARDQRLRTSLEELRKTKPQQYQKVMAFVDHLADFMDYCYVLRNLHPQEDWNQWWEWICDTYDDSAPLRDFFERRQSWYAVGKILRCPKERLRAFRPPRQP